MPDVHQISGAEPHVDAEPSHEAIARRAFEIYLQRGSLPGYEREDWLQAEEELRASARAAAAALEGGSPGDAKPARASRAGAAESRPTTKGAARGTRRSSRSQQST